MGLVNRMGQAREARRGWTFRVARGFVAIAAPLSGGRARRCIGLPRLVLLEPAFEDDDGGTEVVNEGHQEVDVVEVLPTCKAVGEVVAWVDGGLHLAAVRAEEAEVAVAHFGRWPIAAEAGDGQAHRQIVADPTQQVGGSHGLLLSSPRGRRPCASAVASGRG